MLNLQLTSSLQIFTMFYEYLKIVSNENTLKTPKLFFRNRLKYAHKCFFPQIIHQFSVHILLKSLNKSVFNVKKTYVWLS